MSQRDYVNNAVGISLLSDLHNDTFKSDNLL